MSSYVLADVVWPVRLVGGTFCLLGATTNGAVAFLSIMGSRQEKVAFALLIQAAAISNFIVTASGFTTLNRCSAIDGVGVCIPLGPGVFLGERFVNVVDAVVVHLNSTGAVMVGWMMLVRMLILYGVRLKKLTLIFWTAVVLLFPWPQFALIVFGYIPSTDIIKKLTIQSRNELADRVFYSITVGADKLWLWTVTSYLPLATFVFCIPLRIAMEWRLRKFSGNITNHTKKVHRSFMNMLTVDATVTFVYYICCNDTLRMQYFPLTKDIGYLIFSIPVFIQGFSTLYFVPSLRNTFRRLLSSKGEVVTVVSVSHLSN